MDRPTTEVKLEASGYTAHVATYMTYADRQEMAKAIIKNQTINSQTAKDMVEGRTGINGMDAIDSQMVMIKRMTIRLVNPNGEEEPSENVLNLPDTDVDLIVAEVAKIEVPKKK